MGDEVKVIQDAITEGLKPIKEQIDGLKGVSDTVKSIDERVKKIEAMPISKLGFNFNTIPTEYKGYKLSNQLRSGRNDKTLAVFGNEEKANEFVKFMIDFIKASKRDGADLQARADLQEFYRKANLAEGSTGAVGGYLVPDEYLWDMVMLARSRTFALQECSVVNMNTDQMYIPAELTLSSLAWTTPETGQISAGEPTFNQVSLAVKRLDALATVTNELLMDSAIDVVGILTEQFGYGVALELDNQVLNGTGTPVSGLLTAACGYSTVFGATSTNFSAVRSDDFSNAIYQLAEGDLANARFKINRIGLHYCRVLKDTTNAPIFAPMGGVVPNTLYGIPVSVSEKITNTSAISTPMAILGDFKKFIIGRRLGAVGLDVDPYGKFDYYQTRYRVATRWAFAIGRATAFTRIMTPAA